MNVHDSRYGEYQAISNDWPLDDWSITKECFDHIIRILPFDSTILEIGSGKSTELLSKFYSMVSIETSIDWLYKYKSRYIYLPLKYYISDTFGYMTSWLDSTMLQMALKYIKYDLLIVDGGGDRVSIYDHINIFLPGIPIIFDDTMNADYLKCAQLVAEKLGAPCTTFKCKVNKYAVMWFEGKQYTVIN